jgi:acyl-CoA thioesterase
VDEDAARVAFEEALRTQRPDFGTFFLAKLFGLHISYTDDSCIVELPVRDFMFNPQGSLHGGVIAFALDVSMGHLIKRTVGRPGITLEMKTQYLRPAVSGRVRCEGRFLRRGRSINYLESRMTGEDGKLLAVATSTWQLLADNQG